MGIVFRIGAAWSVLVRFKRRAEGVQEVSAEVPMYNFRMIQALCLCHAFFIFVKSRKK